MRAFLLAGGRSRRMGRDKARLELDGHPLVVHMLNKLAALGIKATLCGNRPDLAHLAPSLPDPDIPGEGRLGPLAGILAALEASDADLNLILAVDIPGVPLAFLRWMMGRAGRTQCPATVPFVAGRAQPLCAIYHRSLAPDLRQSLAAGQRRVFPTLTLAARHTDIFDLESIVSTGALDPIPRGFPHEWFRNLNTPREFALYASQHPSNKLEAESAE